MSDHVGDVVYLDVLGKPMLILGSMEAAQELMDKRSGIYSGKPPSSMADLYVKFSPAPHPKSSFYRLS